MTFLQNKTILVTGGGGFLGSHVVDRLVEQGGRAAVARRGEVDPLAANVWISRSKDFNLTIETDVRDLLNAVNPQIVIHLAAVCGGIGINREKPGTFYYENLMMGALLMEQARIKGVEKFVAIGTICAYSQVHRRSVPRGRNLAGYPEETNAPYGIARR